MLHASLAPVSWQCFKAMIKNRGCSGSNTQQEATLAHSTWESKQHLKSLEQVRPWDLSIL